MVIALLLGFPIAFSLAGSGILGIYLTTGSWNKVMGILGMAPFTAVADYSLTTIPMFILMAYFSASSGLARDLFKAGANWLSHIRGGLGVATVFACGIFRGHVRGERCREPPSCQRLPTRKCGVTAIRNHWRPAPWVSGRHSTFSFRRVWPWSFTALRRRRRSPNC